jgi:hypothetical protein
MVLPLLQTHCENGEAARPRDLYDDIADQAGVTAEQRRATVKTGNRKINEDDVRDCSRPDLTGAEHPRAKVQ